MVAEQFTQSGLPADFPESQRLRLFWGIALPEQLNSRLRGFERDVRAKLPGARWVAPEDSHVTLAFLGGRDRAELDSILAAGRKVFAGEPACTLRTAGLGAFPSLRAARILWLGFEPESALAALALRLQQGMASFGCDLKESPYLPHITLARFKAAVPLPGLPAIEPCPVPVREVHLFRSETRVVGPKYTTLGVVRLNACSLPIRQEE